MAMPSIFAALRFITSSNLVGPCTGSSPGRAPLRMRSSGVARGRRDRRDVDRGPSGLHRPPEQVSEWRRLRVEDQRQVPRRKAREVIEEISHWRGIDIFRDTRRLRNGPGLHVGAVVVRQTTPAGPRRSRKAQSPLLRTTRRSDAAASCAMPKAAVPERAMRRIVQRCTRLGVCRINSVARSRRSRSGQDKSAGRRRRDAGDCGLAR